MSISAPPIRILLADDHTILRQGLAALLARQPGLRVVGEAADGAEALERYRELGPDLLLMDLRMPTMDGVAALGAIRAYHPQARVILLTTFDGDGDIYRGLQAGAMGYLLKDEALETLVAAIRAVSAGQRWVAPVVGERLAARVGSDDLTARELAVLQEMARGLSNQEIAAALLIGEGTVKFHVNHILQKLGAPDRTRAVITALKRGLAHLD